ncbi:hypothetical protein BCU12_00515 [Vibrio sp. 10N.261.55.A7]|nr:hypothetical protein BCU12_00515 [Vibrio sp. 10N.261.55.A7]
MSGNSIGVDIGVLLRKLILAKSLFTTHLFFVSLNSSPNKKKPSARLGFIVLNSIVQAANDE